LHQRSSIAQQVHHVQFADESVHNTIVLLKKSMQKKKRAQQQKQLKQAQPPQAQTPQAQKQPKKLLKKRQVEDVAQQQQQPQSVDPKTETAQYVNQAQTQTTTTNDSNLAGTTTSSKRSRSRLVSAYETIVFSESQIPVFLSQDQRHRRQSKNSFRKGLAADAIEENKAETPVSGSTLTNTNADKPLSHIQVRGDDIIDPSQINVALSKRGNTNASSEKKEVQDNAQSPSTGNSSVVVDNNQDKDGLVEFLSSSSSETEVQDNKYHLILEENSSNLSDDDYLTRHDHDPQNYAYMYHGCALKPAILLVLFPAMLLIVYRVYTRKQRQAALLFLPTTFTQFEHVPESKLKDPRRASESSRGSGDMSSFVGYNVQ
ncbi:hypothetical protein BGX26_012688, partial [Mortierella sp. AD094]